MCGRYYLSMSDDNWALEYKQPSEQVLRVQRYADLQCKWHCILSAHGLAAYFWSDIPRRRHRYCESKANDGVEFIIFDVIIRHEKWLFIGVHKPPCVHDDHLIESITNVFRQTQGAYRSTSVINLLVKSNESCTSSNISATWKGTYIKSFLNWESSFIYNSYNEKRSQTFLKKIIWYNNIVKITPANIIYYNIFYAVRCVSQYNI